ncbi:hydrolase [Aggregatibacter actinomycetemcomitans]|uniref:hydrolase n=1 Tax=Aggregatibacter actinomycetemcomitans TaxID=714 RepID=UPI001F11977B|nr:hydrolase [Aggregatibacter actinomycetemcomitans]
MTKSNNQSKKKEMFIGSAYTQCRTKNSYTVCEYIEKRATVIFIGGAADQESYYFQGPNYNITMARNGFNDRLALNPQISSKIKNNIILGYNHVYSESDIQTNVLNKIKSYELVYIIGHSLGGWNAAHLSRILKDKGYNVKMLITLDPVGEGVLVYTFSKIFRKPEPHPKAETWINLRAESGLGHASDKVADFGEQWNITSGPDINEEIQVIHANAYGMFIEKLSTGFSAMDYLFESLIKELT